MDEINLDPYVHVRTVKSLDYGSNGNKISFISDYMGLQQVWEYHREDRRPAQPSFIKEGITFVRYVAGTSDLIVGMDPSGDEREQLYLLKKDGELIALTNSPEHIHLYGGSSPDGKWIAWSSNRRNEAFFDIYIQNLETLEIRCAFAEDGLVSVMEWFPDGDSLLVRRTNTPLDHDLGVLSLLTGGMDWITEHSGEASFQNVHFNKDGDYIYLLSNKDREFFGLACIHLPTKQLIWLETGMWDFEGLAMNKKKNQLAFTINEGGISKGYLLDLEISSVYTWETPVGVITDLKFSPENQKLLYLLNGPTHPSDIWELDLETFKAERLTYFSHNPILEGKLIEPKLIFYRSFDNLQIPAFFYKPKYAAEKTPVVIYIHGGPESQSRAVYNPLLQYFLNIGYAVVTPNIRGSSGYGKTYSHLDDASKRMDAVKDLIFLVEWLKGNMNVDAGKIAIMGGSYGGFMVLTAISHYPNLFAAAVDIVGMSSLRTFLKTTSPWRKKLREDEYGTIEKDGKFFDQIDPLNYADEITAPLLVIHGVNDPRVPIEESEQIVNKLKKRDHPVTFIRIEEEGHKVVKLENKKYAYSNVAEFLKKYIGKNSFS